MNRIERYLCCICRMAEVLAPEILEYSGVQDWWARHRNQDAQLEAQLELARVRLEDFDAFDAKCKILRKLTEEERSILGYGRFPLRLEDYGLGR